MSFVQASSSAPVQPRQLGHANSATQTEDRLKYLVLTTSYPGHDGDPSGHFVRAEARSLALVEGNEVHVIAPSASLNEAPAVDRLAPRLTIHPVGGGSLFGFPGVLARLSEKPYRLLSALPFSVSVRRALFRIGPVDQAIAHWIVPSGFPLLLGHDAPLEVVAHGADVRLLCSMPSFAASLIVQNLLTRGATFRFVASALLIDLAQTLTPALTARLKSVSRVEPAAMDLLDVKERAASLRASFLAKIKTDAFVVVVGRLIASKRVELAIEAAHIAALPIVIVGDGPCRAELERLAKRLGVAAFFLGLLARDEALAWIAAADVVGFVSALEAAPTVVREARALGVSVVACAAGDVVAWAERDPGITIAPPIARPLAEAFVRVIASRSSGR